LITGDLLFSSRVSGAAERAGVRLSTVAAGDAEGVCKLAAESGATLALIDLDAVAATGTLKRIVAGLRETPGGSPTIVAYGAHVHRDRLDAAREAGCDQVLTRGQFDAGMDAILRGSAAC